MRKYDHSKSLDIKKMKGERDWWWSMISDFANWWDWRQQSSWNDYISRPISYIANTIKMNELIVDLFYLEYYHDVDWLWWNKRWRMQSPWKDDVIWHVSNFTNQKVEKYFLYWWKSDKLTQEDRNQPCSDIIWEIKEFYEKEIRKELWRIFFFFLLNK